MISSAGFRPRIKCGVTFFRRNCGWSCQARYDDANDAGFQTDTPRRWEPGAVRTATIVFPEIPGFPRKRERREGYFHSNDGDGAIALHSGQGSVSGGGVAGMDTIISVYSPGLDRGMIWPP